MFKPSHEQLHTAVLYIDGKRTSDQGFMTMAEMVSVNALNASKSNGRVWKPYSVPNTVTGN